MWMSDYFQYLDLSRHSFHIGVIFNFVFFKYFDCYLLASDRMRSHSYFSKSSLAKRPTYLKIVIALVPLILWIEEWEMEGEGWGPRYLPTM
jgi:hypothetical protein